MTTNARKQIDAEGDGEREPCRRRHRRCSAPRQPALQVTIHSGTMGEGDGVCFLGPPEPSERKTWLDKAAT